MRMWRKRLLLSGAVLLALFAAGELFARFVLGLGDPPLSQTHPRIEYLFKPGQDLRRFDNRVFINAYGMRSPEFPQEKAAGELRVLVFGDSVLNGGNLSDQPELATSLLAERLKEVHGEPVIVGNVSAGSWGPGNWLGYVQTYGLFDADAIVLLASSHDIGDNPQHRPLNPQTHPQRRPVSALVEGVTRYLPRYLPRLSVGEEHPPARADESPGARAEAVARGSEDLQAFLTLAVAQAPTIVLQHPERSELGDEAKPGRALIAQIAAKAGVDQRLLDPYLESATAQGTDPYRDNIHINAVGQRALADALFDALVEMGVVPAVSVNQVRGTKAISGCGKGCGRQLGFLTWRAEIGS
ncbi:SGNH/GDSL hydrolase family protein [Lamprobacter modestohalophilus]|uniref:SGNH/GDSL hydrolase family protein n=1 Tax=Lamprobacter modestohalophilus TaxID=1064514 RepID=UPI002ADED89A|nr:SGNH/GDSL hydrolase family protein [Lamprobacter modestohalophilus]MEA1049020.1 SGNH/GDSL hydrolase family protein [Lamprobacter modestohalophilus]